MRIHGKNSAFLSIQGKDARAVVYEQHPDFIEEIPAIVTDHTRWSLHKEVIVKQLSTGKFYRVEYTEPATELQEEECFYDGETYYFPEVIHKDVTVKRWVNVCDQ